MGIPARLHVLLARKSPQAIILRRGPSGQTAVIGWDRTEDRFIVGQWLKGKIYHYRSDISPDGQHWVYFAMGAYSQTWTAVARVPYLKALDFYPKGDAWNGGGLFVSSQKYWLNETGRFPHQRDRYASGLSIDQQWAGQPNLQGECPGIYFRRLGRDGWTEADTAKNGKQDWTFRFYKPLGAGWELWKMFHAGVSHPVGKGPYYESHLLRHAKSGNEIQMPDAQWADLDGKRLLWAEQGNIMSGRILNAGLADQKVLFDTNPLRFTELLAPY